MAFSMIYPLPAVATIVQVSTASRRLRQASRVGARVWGIELSATLGYGRHASLSASRSPTERHRPRFLIMRAQPRAGLALSRSLPHRRAQVLLLSGYFSQYHGTNHCETAARCICCVGEPGAAAVRRPRNARSGIAYCVFLAGWTWHAHPTS